MSHTILLINPPIYDFAAYDLFNKPLGLLYLASFLRRAGFKVRLIDTLDRLHPALQKLPAPAHLKADGTGKYHSEIIEKPSCLKDVPRNYRRYGMPVDILSELLNREYQEHKPIAVLVSSMMTYWYPAVADTIKLLRQTIPDTTIALGGVYARLFPEHAQRVCQPDKLFTGNRFMPVLRWLDNLAGRKYDYGTITDEFTAWPPPAYELYPRLSYLTLITSVGCPFHCDYCAGPLLQPKLSQLAPELFVDQMTSLLPMLDKNNESYHIAFMDDALLARSQDHIIPILDQVKKLNLPLRFYCPNGLHCRFISEKVARLIYANNFKMVRLSYESSDTAPYWQRAGNDKVSDRVFHDAVANLLSAGYRPHQLEAYILTGLPGQTMAEIEQSAHTVHDMGLKIRLCQYTPIPGTKLFETSFDKFGIDPGEPLLHNNSILPTLDRHIGYETFQRFKDHIKELNQSLPRNT